LLYEATIAGTGSYLPNKILTNAVLEKMVDTSDEWIYTRTGIIQRRLADDHLAASDLGVRAALRAMEEAEIEPSTVEFIIVATITPDMPFPATACLIQNSLGATNAAAVDINVACSGFIYGMEIGKQFIVNGTYQTVLVIATEIMSRITDWSDRSTCVLFGDGAGSAVLKRASSKDGRKLVASYLGADGSAADLLKIPAGGSRMPANYRTVEQKLHYLKMSGNEVFKFAVKAMEEAVAKLLSRGGLKTEDVALLIPHQANMRIIDAVARRLGFSRDRIYVNVDRYGNMSAASVAVGLDEVSRQGNLRPGDLIIIVTFGSGFTWAACLIEW